MPGSSLKQCFKVKVRLAGRNMPPTGEVFHSRAGARKARPAVTTHASSVGQWEAGHGSLFLSSQGQPCLGTVPPSLPVRVGVFF